MWPEDKTRFELFEDGTQRTQCRVCVLVVR
jgi:hypothetical protein